MGDLIMQKVIFQIYPHFVERMAKFYQENQQIQNCDIALLGDSLVEMMETKYFSLPNKIIVNRGIVSDKSAGVLMSLEDRLFKINPKTVFLFVGSNDICDGYTLREIENNYSNILNMIESYNPNCKIVMSNIIPPCYYTQYSHIDHIYPDCRNIDKIIELNKIIASLPNKFSNLKIFDAFSLMADENNSLRSEESLDGVHLTPKAYQRFVKELEKLF